MKNAKIHFSKFEIYMAQSIHGFIPTPFDPLKIQSCTYDIKLKL